jgi:hypothetical protein
MSFRSFDLYNLLRDFGETVTLRKMTTAGSYNPVTGSVSGSATTDYSVTGYFYNYELMNVDQVRRGMRKCLISALDNVEPYDQDIILGNGDAVTITSVTTIFSAGTAICYICNVEE